MIYAVGGLFLVTMICLPGMVQNWLMERSPPKPGQGLWFWLSLFILIVGFGLGLGEFVILAFVVAWCVVWAWRLRGRWIACLPLTILLVFLIGHSQGYKPYGSPSRIDNRPLLTHPLEVDHLEEPNIVVATDGSRHALKGVAFRADLFQLPPSEQRRMVDRLGTPLRFQGDDGCPSGFVTEHRNHYFCGNSFFPTFFPQALPTHTKLDLAESMTGLTVPKLAE